MDADRFADLLGPGRGPGRPDEPGAPPAPADPLAVACIRREFMGGSEHVTYPDFCDLVIQDDDVARRVARDLLGTHPAPYAWNEDAPEYAETFTVADVGALGAQLDAYADER